MNEFAERAHAAVKNGDMAEAARWFERVLEEEADDAGSRAWLGQCLCAVGRRADGTAHLRHAGQHFAAAARNSGDIGLLLELAGELQHWSDFAGALVLGEETARIAPSEARGFEMLALTYAQLNRAADALDAGRRALRLQPQNIPMKVLQASLEADAGENAAARTRLVQLLGGKLEPRQAFRAHKELARVLDQLGDHDLVFRHLHAAAALSGALPEFAAYDARAIPAIIESHRTGFTPELLAHWSDAAPPRDRPPPTFLIGFMRSGTTLTQAVLGAHRDVFVSDEVDFVSATLRHLHRMNPARLGTADKLRRLTVPERQALRNVYWTRVEQHFGNDMTRRVFIDKFTMNTIDIGLIACIFPDARIIFVQRDPRDVCLSSFMQLMVPSPTTVQLLCWDSTARFYAQVMGWWLHIRKMLSLDVMELRYEDAVGAFDPTFKKLFAFLDLDWDPDVANFHNNVRGRFIASPSRRQVAQPLYSSSVARWRRYAKEFKPVMQTLHPFVDALDYDVR